MTKMPHERAIDSNDYLINSDLKVDMDPENPMLVKPEMSSSPTMSVSSENTNKLKDDAFIRPESVLKNRTTKSRLHPRRYTTANAYTTCAAGKPLASKIRLFGEISSIRGVQRIFRAEAPFIRILWIVFVIFMTGLLTVSSFMLIVDYLRYTTSWHTRSLPEDHAEFPAITLCAHNPFSLNANHLWHTGEVISPNQVKSFMAAVSLELMHRNEVANSVMLALSDSFEFYYTNLNHEDSRKISHDFAIIPHCILYSPTHSVVVEKCELENSTAMNRRKFSHPKYFNCLTIEGAENQDTSDVSRLVILAHLVPSSQIVEAKSSFIMDTFTRGEGIKVVVHERNTYPEIEKYGFNVQPNRMNEIIYETISWKRLSTPVAPCKDAQLPVSDLNENYTYDMNQCSDIVVQAEMIRRCGCMNSEWPRPSSALKANNRIPYCTTVDRSSTVGVAATVLSRRMACAQMFFENLTQIREQITLARTCIPRCHYFTYDTKLSVTSWEPSPVKLSSYTDNYRVAEGFQANPTSEERKQAFRDYLNFIIDPTMNRSTESSRENLSNYKQFSDGTYTYISLIRRDFETKLYEERLVFDAHILLSRIGGLCSLCIGLTMAFFIEIIEFIYALCQTDTSKYSSSHITASDGSKTNEIDNERTYLPIHSSKPDSDSARKTNSMVEPKMPEHLTLAAPLPTTSSVTPVTKSTSVTFC